MSQSHRNAILYDAMERIGGAESVISTLLYEWTSYELVTAYIDPRSDLHYRRGVHTLGKSIDIPGVRQILSWYAFERKTRFLQNYDTVLFSGFNSLAAVNNRPRKNHDIYYCHTPPRFLYDLNSYYKNQFGPVVGRGFKIVCDRLRPKYEAALDQIDVVVANSKNVEKRLIKYLGCQSQVIYPPVNLENYKWIGQDNYYLSTARLESYKRVDLIIKAFLSMPEKNLIVASSGKEFKSLSKLAKDASNIQFTNWCTQQQLQTLIGNAIATIYIPMNEDFGISPVESLAAGKPVIGVAEGGLLETIVHGETGLLLKPEELCEDSLCQALEKMTKEKAQTFRLDCIRSSKTFSKEVFNSKIRSLIGSNPSN